MISSNPAFYFPGSQPAQARGECPICLDLCRSVTVVTPCCWNEMDRDCLQRLFANTPLGARTACPVCRVDLPDLSQSQHSMQGTGTMQTPKSRWVMSYELVSALKNNDWDKAEGIQLSIQNTGVMLVERARRELSNKLMEVLDSGTWAEAGRLKRIIQGIGAEPTHELMKKLNNKLIEALNRRDWDNADRLQCIIQGIRAWRSQKVLQLLFQMLTTDKSKNSIDDEERLERINSANVPDEMEEAQSEAGLCLIM